jgi:hypothetical protein
LDPWISPTPGLVINRGGFTVRLKPADRTANYEIQPIKRMLLESSPIKTQIETSTIYEKHA